jgi:uncharacterized SAM-binding protein YcdF (DUF218 family)
VSETPIARFYPRTTDAGGTLWVVRRFLVVCAVGLLAAWGLGWLILMNDEDELPNDADAVVVLAGSESSLPRGQALVGGGIAPTLVVSTGRGTRDARRRSLCRNPPENVLCVVRGPFVTGGELQAIAKVARNRDWDTVVVVAPSYMSLRLDRVFERCANQARVVQDDIDEPWWRDAIAIPLEWVNLAVAETVRRDC